MKAQSLQLLVALLCCAGFSEAATVRYVDQNGGNPLPPFTDWSTAATNIQDAIDAADPGDLILVTNGVYEAGGMVVAGSLTNRVAITKPLAVESVNGPAVTIIRGYQVPGTTNGDAAVRCAYLTNGASLTGFTLRDGAVRNAGDPYSELTGAGAWCESTNSALSNCVFVANAALDPFNGGGGGAFFGTLDHCVLINNTAAAGGAAYGAVLNNCLVVSNSSFKTMGGGVLQGTLNGCIVTHNLAPSGGGAAGSILNDCIVSNNTATSSLGGGVSSCTLNACVLTGNSAGDKGGAAYGSILNNCAVLQNTAFSIGGGTYASTLSNCVLAGNSARYGGGASQGTLSNCILSNNIAYYSGGGANSNSLNNCALLNNVAINTGGGGYFAKLNNCTVVGNTAFSTGGGADACNLTNCIVYFNNAPTGSNYSGGTLDFSCTLPLPPGGTGNISADPQLAGAFHLSGASPCRGAGSALFAVGVDIDGQSWSNPPSIGCDEFHSEFANGGLQVLVASDYTGVAVGFPVRFQADVLGQATRTEWDFGDGTILTNQPFATHTWSSSGQFVVICRAFNDSHPEGVSNTIPLTVIEAPVQYVALASANPVPPYLSWPTAATNIQDALDCAFGGGTIVVSNGTYASGGRAVYGALTNRVAVTRSVLLQSLNGPDVTAIEGFQEPGTVNGLSAVRCVYLASGSTLAGFTLRDGATRVGNSTTPELDSSGGGVWSESSLTVISNCVISSNACNWYGAGSYSGTLLNCTVSNNTNHIGSVFGGGGAAFSTIRNSTLRNNSAMSGGGGAISCTLSNCLVAANYGGGALKSTLANCVVTGNAGSGVSGGSADGCIISSNTVQNLLGNNNGGGAFQATLTACVLSDNRATNGGGAFNCSLNSCVLSNNVAALIGGGLYMDGAATNGLAGNNLFLGNSAGTHGGGFYLARIGTFVLTNWTFTGNSARNDGGGFYSANGTETLRGCTITGNSAGGNGGGVSCTASGTILASNCTFTANTAGTNGGGLNLQLGSSLTNCLLSSNSAALNGGGVAGGSLTVCSVVGNSAGGNGGGTSSSTVNRCIVSGNRASLNGGGSAGGIVSLSLLTSNLAGFGGGVYSAATLNNSTLTGNVATNNGGGIYATVGTFTSCIIYGNTAPSGTNFASAITLNSCCTTPLPPSGTGNLTNNPVFIDPASGNFRLQTNSPCIDAGSGSPGATDLDGRPRLVGVKIDIGAYEFQGPGIGEFTAWLQLWGLPVNGSADFTDNDTDGLNNWQEWIAGTVPTDASSVLKLLTPSPAPSGVTVTWQSVSGKTYFLQRAGDLAAQPAFSSIQSNIVGQLESTTFIDVDATNAGPFFYRVGVQ
jgi:hypothetical protein